MKRGCGGAGEESPLGGAGGVGRLSGAALAMVALYVLGGWLSGEGDAVTAPRPVGSVLYRLDGLSTACLVASLVLGVGLIVGAVKTIRRAPGVGVVMAGLGACLLAALVGLVGLALMVVR